MIKERKNKKIFLVFGILGMLGIIIGVSYALWTLNVTQTGVNVITTGCLRLEFTDENPISLEKTYPIRDSESVKLTPYTFTIQNTCETSNNYEVNLEVMDIVNRLDSEYIALAIDNREKSLLKSFSHVRPTYKDTDYTAVESYQLIRGTLAGNEIKKYDLRLWVDESTTASSETMNKSFISKISVTATVDKMANLYKESILHGADPVLNENLIPVVISDDGTVKKANLEEEWYSYEKKNWANAVILEDESVEYQNGDTIPEGNIESYFVWIPKYSYQLWDLGSYNDLSTIDETKVHTIPIRFGTANTMDETEGECTTPMLSGESGSCVVGDYMTHPAFISMNTNGLWVGKFETGYKDASSKEEAESNEILPDKLQIKPNVYSWRMMRPVTMHLTSYNYKRELDSHMMKNTEWGAVSYLQHSVYGNATKVRINNNISYITGYAAKDEPSVGYDSYIDYEETSLNQNGSKTFMYNTATGYLASTTGNISGIYDMSGGSAEFVMAVSAAEDGSPLSGQSISANSGFIGKTGRDNSFVSEGVVFPSTRYYDKYRYGTSMTQFSNRILGDATGEMGPVNSVRYGTIDRQNNSWHQEASWMTNSTAGPWFTRGGTAKDGILAGVFYAGNSGGAILLEQSVSFRVILAI